VKALILAGGSGTRLWPLSRQTVPKQFMSVLGGESLLTRTAQRAVAVAGAENVVVVAGRNHAFQVRNHVREVLPEPMAHVVLEPTGRNTAPAVGLGLSWLQEHAAEPDDVVLVMASDHLIQPMDAFIESVRRAEALARQGYIVTFGIPPTRPETGYGYIRVGDPVDPGFRVARFTEKPDRETAAQFLASGEYFWNSGMFVFRMDVMMTAFQTFLPEIHDAMAGGVAAMLGAFDSLPSVSIDVGVMERTERAAMVPASFQWSDVGSWDSFFDVLKKDAAFNVIQGDVLPLDTENSLILGDRRLIATVGVRDLLIVETPDAVLIARKGAAESVKTVVAALEAEQRAEVREHRTVDRPWGSYTVLDEQPGNKIKRIVVAPGEKLSLQLHHHRSEHWVVTRGTATVTIGDEVLTVRENESVYVPVETKHRLENRTASPLEIVEVQVGDYVGEDDIVRFDDIYGRSLD